MHKQTDVLIVGGGLVGSALLHALTQQGIQALLVEANPLSTAYEHGFDARTLAISPASVSIFQALGVWDALEPLCCPIRSIHISQQRRFGQAKLNGENGRSLGYMLEMEVLRRVLHEKLRHESVIAPAKLIALNKETNEAKIETTEQTITIQANIVVAADGVHSTVRQLCGLKTQVKSYPQDALVTNIGLARDHHHIAYERFTSHGPMAILPMNDKRAAVVWTLPPAEVAVLKDIPEREFLQKFQHAFGYRMGRFTQVGRRASFPLKHMFMPQQVEKRVVFVGNAAHTLHPVAGQGFNLGLRDVAMLTECFVREGLSEATLLNYQEKRLSDQKIISQFTDGLIGLFTSRVPGVGFARQLGLMAFEHSPTLKNTLAHYARGHGGTTPSWVSGLSIDGEGIN